MDDAGVLYARSCRVQDVGDIDLKDPMSTDHPAAVR
jgi:hypothetical protein